MPVPLSPLWHSIKLFIFSSLDSQSSWLPGNEIQTIYCQHPQILPGMNSIPFRYTLKALCIVSYSMRERKVILSLLTDQSSLPCKHFIKSLISDFACYNLHVRYKFSGTPPGNAVSNTPSSACRPHPGQGWTLVMLTRSGLQEARCHTGQLSTLSQHPAFNSALPSN